MQVVYGEYFLNGCVEKHGRGCWRYKESVLLGQVKKMNVSRPGWVKISGRGHFYFYFLLGNGSKYSY